MKVTRQDAVLAAKDALLNHQIALFTRYEFTVNTIVSCGFAEEQAREIANQAVELNAQIIAEGYEKRGLGETVKSAVTAAKIETDKLFFGGRS